MEKKRLEIILIYIGTAIPFILCLFVIDRAFALVGNLLFILSLFLKIKERQFPSIIVNLLAILFVLIFMLSVNLENFLPSSLTTIMLLLCIKLLEKPTLRNVFQVYLLALLLYAGLTYFYTHFSFFILFVCNLLYFPIALFIHLYLQEGGITKVTFSELKSSILTMGVILFATLLISILFFIFFPRLNQPLFQIGVGEKKAKTGFTEAIRLGEVSQIQESSAKVLRLELSEAVSPSELYFRVIVYDYFDGRSWKRRFNPPLRKEVSVVKGPKISGTVYLEIPQGDFLPVVEAPASVRGNMPIIAFSDYTYQTGLGAVTPIKYNLVFSLTKEKPALERDFSPYLQFPELSQRIKDIAESLKGETPYQTALNIYKYLSSPPFSYSMKDLPISSSPLEDFLFKTKKGNCEYFAGAMAVLLRLNGIPARVVGGYRGAIYQRVGNYYVVEERFAHAWVEAYIDGKWLLFDPTPQRGARPFEESSFLKRLSLILDLINYQYTKLILDYDLGKQKKLISLAKEIFAKEKLRGIPQVSPKSLLEPLLGVWLLLIVVGVLILAILIKLIPIYFKPKEKRLLYEFLTVLKKASYERGKNQGLSEFVEALPEKDFKDLAREFVKTYQSCYYKDKDFTKEDLERLAFLLKSLKEKLKREGRF
jgi:transglutaminase-like putative cysteine protease